MGFIVVRLVEYIGWLLLVVVKCVVLLFFIGFLNDICEVFFVLYGYFVCGDCVGGCLGV